MRHRKEWEAGEFDTSETRVRIEGDIEQQMPAFVSQQPRSRTRKKRQGVDATT